jgi:hypothetical protein
VTDLSMRIFAYAVVVVFLGILLWYVPRIDLGAVIVLTLALAGYDFFGRPRPKGR